MVSKVIVKAHENGNNEKSSSSSVLLARVHVPL